MNRSMSEIVGSINSASSRAAKAGALAYDEAQMDYGCHLDEWDMKLNLDKFVSGGAIFDYDRAVRIARRESMHPEMREK